MKTISVVLSFLLLASCQKNKGLQTLEWHSGDSLRMVEPLTKIETSPPVVVSSLSESVKMQEQTIAHVKVEGSYIKYLCDRHGRSLAVRAAFNQKDEEHLYTLAQNLSKGEEVFRKHLPLALPFFRTHPPIEITPLLMHHRGYFEPVWKVVYLDRYGAPWEVRFGEHMQIRSVNRVGSRFHDAVAYVFPKGPKVSILQEVTLKDLSTTDLLSNDHVSVTSQADTKISSVDEPLKFSVQDSRFDQLQVFYFLNESLSWFEHKVQFKLPFQLQAEVAIGSPEKTNSAFYYQGKIRLGTGDGETYSRIPQDPSIVIHESVHAVVEALARLPYDGEGGSLNEAFADFFAALQLDTPNMGEVAYLKGPFRRSLVNDLKLSDKNGGLYHDSGIISGTLWDLKTRFGQVPAQKIALMTLNRLTPASDFADFNNQLKSVLPVVFSNDDLKTAQTLLHQRGFQ